MNLLFLLVSVLPALSTPDTTATEKISPSVVSSYARYENSISAFGSALPGLTGKGLDGLTGGALSQNVTLEQALRLSSQIDVRERGGRSVQTDLGIRGGSPDQTGILLNGIDFTDVRTGHQSHSLPVDTDILQGARLLDGGNAGLTGAVNILAGPAAGPDYIRVHAAGGQHGYAYGNISGSHTIARRGILNIFEAVSYRRSDGYQQNTDFDNKNLYARVQYRNGRTGNFDAQAGYQNRAFGANGFYSLKFPDQFEQTSTGIASLRWTKTIHQWILESYVAYRGNTDRFELIRGSEAKVPFNYHRTDNYTAYGSAAYVWIAGRSSLSGTWHRGDIRSTVLGDAVSADEQKQVPGASGRFFTKEKTREWGQVQLMHQKNWDRLSVKAAFEGLFSPFGFAPLWNAGADWKASDAWTFDLMAAQTMRLPTFTDLYYTATGYIGNPDLKPERAVMTKAAAQYSKGAFMASADLWYRHCNDVIDWVRETATDPWQSSQITSLDATGADISFSYSPSEGLLKSLVLSYGFIDMSKSADGYVSKYALDYMKNKVSLAGDLRLGRHFTAGANASLYDRCGNYSDAQGNTCSYEPYALLNANVSYTTGAFRFYIDADNVTGTRYYDYGGLTMPGFWAVAGMVITLR